MKQRKRLFLVRPLKERAPEPDNFHAQLSKLAHEPEAVWLEKINRAFGIKNEKRKTNEDHET